MFELLAVFAVMVTLGLLKTPEGTEGEEGGEGGEGAGETTDKPGEEKTDKPGEKTDKPPADASKKTFTQADVDKMMQDRLARQTKQTDKTTEDLQTKLTALEEAEAERERAELTETEKLQADLVAAQAQVKTAEEGRASAQHDALRSQVIAQHGADLPPAYHTQVQGENAEALLQSVEEARTQHTQDLADYTAKLLSNLATATPEQLTETYGEAATALVTRLEGKPPSIGGPGAAGAAPPPGDNGTGETDPTSMTAEQLDAAVKKAGGSGFKRPKSLAPTG